eukprot:763242-Hanusia_phi.AAC.2
MALSSSSEKLLSSDSLPPLLYGHRSIPSRRHALLSAVSEMPCSQPVSLATQHMLSCSNAVLLPAPAPRLLSACERRRQGCRR